MRTMVKRSLKRFWQIGCLTSFLLVLSIFVCVFASTNQMPTTNIISQQTVFALHGPLHPYDEGVKSVWEALIDDLERKEMLAGKVLKWCGVPRELTLALYDSQPLRVVAVNFRRGFRWLWLLMRILGKHYKGTHYISRHSFTFGMHSGTAIVVEDETAFHQVVENLALARGRTKQTPKLTRQLQNRHDFVGFIKPQIFRTSDQFPANLGEIGIDIVDANELRGSVFWICQGEREAEAMMKVLERMESKMAAEYARKGVRCSFRKHREEMFVWWEFRLTNFMALLF